MARKKLVEHNALVQAIEMGTPQSEIMERFGFKTVPALKTAYYNGLVALGKIEDVNTKRKKKNVDTKIRVNGKGSLVIPKKLVDHLGIDPEDVFEVVKNSTGLELRKAERPPKTILRKRAQPPMPRKASNYSRLPN
ncbi:hypothetical protein DSCO28_13880 [Desulfosarcina ovata subsp. sediminis]|uniref:SpoVT-AbrB domain-containing protein n=1 Tax=Desulfosarcina ovata subsp. sediminis TaxID=885957 RepID=A0A5K7ZFG5_9BACT|nr:AbrB/MazE/SpoVT family DNA-binding domain-containing protein [Desulfosarcina ovata]BBO80822.1 hypothetical protein DSCO28_13880 [Desulfosarcina ovata subsp. sediminis]